MRRTGLLALVALALLSCAPDHGPELPVVRRIPLPSGSFSTLFVDAPGRVWVGGVGELRRGGQESGASVGIPIAGGAVPRVIAASDDRLFVRAGERLLALNPEGGETLSEREGVEGLLLLDVRDRFLIRAAASGMVMGLDLETLEPLWAWPSLGGAMGVALAPEGDRLYLAVSRGEGAWALLNRDLQTGRAVHGEALAAPVASLHAAGRGGLVAVVGSAGEESLVAMDPGGGRLRTRWRRGLRSLGLEGPVEVRIDLFGGRVALLAPGHESGLRVLDAETGELVGSVEGPLLDAAFAADGSSLYLLAESEVRVVGTGG